ncbi:MAG: UTP--glucose-1-phosphate uridylyltransferase [Dehalococcoidia bacterium]|nr:UTP--glucose-1-phosphate uridylyltransferase [Dehalococcoidia bacterium]
MEDVVGVILAAGWGTRLLPATKSVPKEMLPLVDRPLIHYTLQELVDSGITHTVVVTARGKEAIQSYFDSLPELEQLLAERGNSELLDSVHAIVAACNLTYVRQAQQLGIAHAVYAARRAIGHHPFVLCFPDDVIAGESPVAGQLLSVHRRFGASVLAVERVPLDQIGRYGVVQVEPAGNRLFRVTGLVEKPKPQDAPSDLAIVGRYVLTPGIFEAIEGIAPGANGELQITDAIQRLLASEPVYAYAFEGERFDTGNPLGYLRSAVALALKRPSLAAEARVMLLDLLRTEPSPVA